MKVYYKLTQKYNLSNHPQKAFNPTKNVAVVTANSSEIGIETSLLASKSSSAYAPTKFALEGSSEPTRYKLNESGINIVVKPGLVKTKLFEEMNTAFDIKPSQNYPFAHLTETAVQRFRALLNNRPSSLNLVARTVLNIASSENREVRYLVGDDSLGIVKVRETASDNNFENGLYERIFKGQQEQLQPQQQQYLFAPRTE
jgi:hypothetical protein